MSQRLRWVFAATAAFILLFFGACEITVTPPVSPPSTAPAPPTGAPAPYAPRSILSAPVSVTVDYARTFVIQHYDGGAEIGGATGGAAWTDLYLFWQHPDPAQVDYYEVYTTTNAPYFSVPVSATLAFTTTAQRGVFLESPERFNPIASTAGVDVRSAMDFYVLRAVNAAGTSGASATFGIVNWSLAGGEFDPAHPPAYWPTPRPTGGPTPTPVPTATLTPVPTGTAGPSPTP